MSNTDKAQVVELSSRDLVKSLKSDHAMRHVGEPLHNLCVEMHGRFDDWTFTVNDMVEAAMAASGEAVKMASFVESELRGNQAITPEQAALILNILVEENAGLESEWKRLDRHLARIRRHSEILRKRLLRGRTLGKAIIRLQRKA